MKKGFTLIELLVVIAILALLMSVIIITINPAELLRKARDTKRIADLSAFRTALNMYVAEGSTNLGANCGAPATRWYLSLTGTGAKCGGLHDNTWCVSTPRLTTSSGWVPVNFGAISTGSPLSALPIDPTNSSSTGHYYYAYGCGSSTFELNANMESTYYTSGSTNIEANDGGNASTTYEIGSQPGLDALPAATTGFYL